MSPTTLALTVLGATAASTGVGIAVVNLTNANSENIEEKIEKLWEEVMKNFNYLNTRITEITQEESLKEKYPKISSKITQITQKTKDSTTQNPTIYSLKSYENPQEMYTQLQQIQKELSEVFKLLEKAKKI